MLWKSLRKPQEEAGTRALTCRLRSLLEMCLLFMCSASFGLSNRAIDPSRDAAYKIIFINQAIEYGHETEQGSNQSLIIISSPQSTKPHLWDPSGSLWSFDSDTEVLVNRKSLENSRSISRSISCKWFSSAAPPARPSLKPSR